VSWHFKAKANGLSNPLSEDQLPFVLPSVVEHTREELVPASESSTHPYFDLMDPLLNHIPLSPGVDPTMDDNLIDENFFWWSPEIDDLSEDLLFGRFELGENLFLLFDAGYRFTFDVDMDPALVFPGPLWRARRLLHRQRSKASLPATPPVSLPPPPSYNLLASQFLQFFNPAVSARPFIPHPDQDEANHH
jgi:hypothetical protein